MSLKIGIITNGNEVSYSLSKILEAINKKKHTYILYDVNDIMIKISPSLSGYDSISSASTGRKLDMCDVVLWRGGGTGKKGLNLLRFFINKDIPVSHAPAFIQNCADKFRTHLKLSQNKIRNPKTVLLSDLNNWYNGVRFLGGTPLMIKTLVGSQGSGVFYCGSTTEVGNTVERLKDDGKKSILLQSFIKTEKRNSVSDYRVFTIMGNIVATMKRTGADGKKIANISAGGSGESATLTDKQEKMVINAVKAIGGQYSITGTDILVNSKGETYVIEINSNPGLKIQDYTGVNVSAVIIEFLEMLHTFKERNNTAYSKMFIEGKSIEQIRQETNSIQTDSGNQQQKNKPKQWNWTQHELDYFQKMGISPKQASNQLYNRKK